MMTSKIAFFFEPLPSVDEDDDILYKEGKWGRGGIQIIIRMMIKMVMEKKIMKMMAFCIKIGKWGRGGYSPHSVT